MGGYNSKQKNKLDIINENLLKGYNNDSNNAISNYIIETINNSLDPLKFEINKLKDDNQKIKIELKFLREKYEKLEEPEPVNMFNETILKEIESGDYSEEQKKIVKDAVFYEGEPDGGNAQSLLGGEIGIRGQWVDND
jgi:predicted nuclease with TOPRIM domain